tara:strand:- start:312 stop:1127 length:816 start_codon:yes stop_codon:yes gene_type:complete
MNPKEEKELRFNIKTLIEYVKQKKLNEEKQLRSIIRSLINYEVSSLNEAGTPDVDPTPNKSTGINVLEDLLKKIVPVLEDDYKLLTTDDVQRQSFRAHIVKAIVNTLTPTEANNEAGDAAAETSETESLEEVIDINVGGGGDEDKFIDIRTDAEKRAEEEPPDPRADFGKGLEAEDQTGRNMAYATFNKVETSIIDSYELLSNEEDQELFYDYLIANVKLYFDKFENELEGQVEEPTNQAYDMAKSQETGEEGGMQPGPEEPTPDEIELGL